MTNQTNENIKQTLLTGEKGIFKIVGLCNGFFSTWRNITPLLLALLTVSICLICKIDSLKLIIEIKSQMLSFLPGILGFTIAGFALMVGFIQGEMLKSISEKKNDSNFSLYQEMSASFALNVLIQAIALVFAFLIHFIIYFDNETKVQFSEGYLNAINTIGLFILAYWFTISLLMTLQVIVNVFSFSQLHHYFVNKEKIAEDTTNDTKKPRE